jgi:hypothetical protein
MAQVVEIAQWLDPGLPLGRLAVAATEAAKVNAAAARVWEQDRVL